MSYCKVLGREWFYLSTILDDYSRYSHSCELCTNLRAGDVTDTLDLALQASGCTHVHVVHKARPLSDNGQSYVSGDLAEGVHEKSMRILSVHFIIPRRQARSSDGIKP